MLIGTSAQKAEFIALMPALWITAGVQVNIVQTLSMPSLLFMSMGSLAQEKKVRNMDKISVVARSWMGP
jgi:hypothetical protein